MPHAYAWRLDREAPLRSLILAGLSYWLLQLGWSGNLRLYVHPRFTLPVTLAAAALLLLAGFQLTRLLRPLAAPNQSLGGRRLIPYVVLLLPLLLGLILPGGGLGTQLAEQRGLGGSFTDGHAVTAAAQAELQQWLAGTDGPQLVSNDRFRAFTSLLWTDPTSLEGEQVQLSGWLYQPDDFPFTLAFIGRYEISCCAADAVVVGCLCLVPADQPPPLGAWVTVVGKIGITDYAGRPAGLIMIDEMRVTTPPDDPYLYTGK